MNYIFSIKTNDNDTYNLVYNKKDKLYRSPENNYLDLPYFKNLLKKDHKPNFNIGNQEYYIYYLELNFSYYELYLYFNNNSKDINTTKLRLFLDDKIKYFDTYNIDTLQSIKEYMKLEDQIKMCNLNKECYEKNLYII